jgi:hypothetical protein
VITGNEKAGPYQACSSLSFSPDGKILAYNAEIDYVWYKKILMEGKTYTGTLCNGTVVYIDGNTIYKRESLKTEVFRGNSESAMF